MMSEEYLNNQHGIRSVSININDTNDIFLIVEFLSGQKYSHNITEDFDKIWNNNYNYYSFL